MAVRICFRSTTWNLTSKKLEHKLAPGWMQFESKALLQYVKSMHSVNTSPKTDRRKESSVVSSGKLKKPFIGTDELTGTVKRQQLYETISVSSIKSLSGKRNQLDFKKV